jgi:hypothetical protein
MLAQRISQDMAKAMPCQFASAPVQNVEIAGK